MSSHGLAAPEIQASLLTDVFLPVALAIIMLGMGLNLTGADFRRVRQTPVAVAAGVAAQFLVLPILGLVVAVVFARYFGLSPHLALGILLLACCPGGATSNLLAYLARADAALSVTLTSITSLLSPLVTPAIFLAGTTILFGDASIVRVGFLEMAVLVLLIVALPIALGMQARRRFPRFAARAERPFRVASIVFFALVIVGLIIGHRDIFWEAARQSVPASLALNALALGAGSAVGWLARLAPASRRALSIEVGFQNGTLAIAIALAQLGSPQAAIAPGFYSLVMFATGGALAWWWGRGFVQIEPAEDAADAAEGRA